MQTSFTELYKHPLHFLACNLNQNQIAMPWKETTILEEKIELKQELNNISTLKIFLLYFKRLIFKP